MQLCITSFQYYAIIMAALQHCPNYMQLWNHHVAMAKDNTSDSEKYSIYYLFVHLLVLNSFQGCGVRWGRGLELIPAVIG